MACKKSELISALSSFGSARATGDNNLIEFSVYQLSKLIDTLEFAPEDEPSLEVKPAAESTD